MKGFIEVLADDRCCRLIRVEEIKVVKQLPNGNAFIERQFNKCSSWGIETLNDYYEVLEKIAEAQN